jgi:hypothetical protein
VLRRRLGVSRADVPGLGQLETQVTEFADQPQAASERTRGHVDTRLLHLLGIQPQNRQVRKVLRPTGQAFQLGKSFA